MLTRWPSYVYECPLSDEDPSKSCLILEPINGINGVPQLVVSLSLDSGLAFHSKRISQLRIALNKLKEIPCKSMILARNFDYSQLHLDEESKLLEKASMRTQSELILTSEGLSWNLEDQISFGTCLGPASWRADHTPVAMTPFLVFEDGSKRPYRLPFHDLGVISYFKIPCV